ncbi:carbohydrate kinase family protein [Occultella aeris]|uniref:Aminoimidazole riboside kinase n=1 Tax=Occultella aeris TaxID=2761496 RepID=A0A7M4DGS9_9MICO|nr:PfkB family carbohydrate kinase [Occultella aeris]VZO36122.1 aminoimidazole riboside kinase [Occultella aeris]
MDNIRQVAFGHVVIDDIVLADGRELTGLLGGAGAYAALGQAMGSGRRVALLSGIGADFPTEAATHLRAAGVDPDALTVLDEHTPRTRIRYFPDGEREESPAYGLTHFVALDPSAAMLPQGLGDLSGIYAFASVEDPLWQDLPDLARTSGATLLWEIHADSCAPGRFDEVAARLADVDILSLNRAEARNLCGSTDLTVCLSRLLEHVGVLALRLGSDGALVATRTLVARARPAARAVIDPTGAGNAFSGALVGAWPAATTEEETDLRSPLAAAMAAAALTIAQYGPPPVTESVRADFRALARSVEVALAPLDSLQNGTQL